MLHLCVPQELSLALTHYLQDNHKHRVVLGGVGETELTNFLRDCNLKLKLNLLSTKRALWL